MLEWFGAQLVRDRASLGTQLDDLHGFGPVIGYDEAADIAKVAFKNGSTVREETLRRGLVEPEELDRLLDPGSMTRPA